MKTNYTRFFLLVFSLTAWSLAKAQGDWPKTISGPDGMVIKMYQPEPESYSANILKFRSAISVVETGSSEPVFGTFWSTCKLEPKGNSRVAAIESVNVNALKIPAITDQHDLDLIKSTLEYQVPQVATQVSLNDIETALQRNQQEARLADNLSTKAPKVIFTTNPSILVYIDGAPKLEKNSEWGLDMVVNSPYTIIRNEDNQFYLYGGHHWYSAPAATGPYEFANSVPANLYNIGATLDKNEAANENGQQNEDRDQPVPAIIVSTTPAELIQSKGEPDFAPISGTNLLYVTNSNNDIFMDLGSQMYYVLISGRWYRSKAMNSNHWEFVPADHLPGDFAKIPEGSPKDNVLASVAGTPESKEAVMNAQVPQTARVDRSTATTQVNYSGDPIFEPIRGTRLYYAVNTSSTVLRYKGLFYTVDNGVWFVSGDPNGPWAVASDRPDDVDLIPPSNPAYNTKYVYIYDEDPDYVYTGYTPGYLNSYVYGPTIVYGTGYYYDPWWGSYYYPRPCSWGFNFGYNPWYGWSFGFGYGWGGWFNMGFGYPYGGWCGGWWGPAAYHPPYCGWGGYNSYGGYYAQNGAVNRTNYYSNYQRNSVTNIYNNRTGVSSARNYSGFGANMAARQTNRSQAGYRNSVFGNQAFNNYNAQSRFNRNNPQASFNRNNGRTYNSFYSGRQGSNAQRNTQGFGPANGGRAFGYGADPRLNTTRSFGQPSQNYSRNPFAYQGNSGSARNFGGRSYSAPRSFGGFSGGSSRSMGSYGGGAVRSFGGGGGAGRSFGGFGGGGGGRSFGGGGGGGGRSFGGGGGGGRSFGGGGGRGGRR